MPRVLITGFEPFGGATVNPSALAAGALHGRGIAGREVVAAVLPCAFGASRSVLDRLLADTRPELVVSVGQASGRDSLGLERVALNIDDAAIPDNDGAQPRDTPIAIDGPVAYWSTLPIRGIEAALREARIPARVSDSAGTFVCNHVFYGLMRSLAATPGALGGFIHVPLLPEQAVSAPGASGPPTGVVPTMPLEQIVRGLEIAIAVSLRGG